MNPFMKSDIEKIIAQAYGLNNIEILKIVNEYHSKYIQYEIQHAPIRWEGKVEAAEYAIKYALPMLYKMVEDKRKI